MSETSAMLIDMAERLFAGQFDDSTMRSARSGIWPAKAWDAASELGLPLALVQGEQGFDIPPGEGLALIRALGRHAAPIPLAETMFGNALLAASGLPVAAGIIALCPQGSGIKLLADGANWHAIGKAERIAWARNADHLLIEDEGRIGLVSANFRISEQGSNLSHMPRDTVLVDASAQVAPIQSVSLLQAGALARALAMAGALETVTTQTIAHVTERVQFGRALSAFQAVQHSLARLAEEAAAASAAADLAADAFASNSQHLDVAIAAARARISEAAGTAIGLAHQLHGAIGFTEEHRLHWFTTALWSWRDEFGSATWWTRRLGVAALGQSGRAYWPFITAI